MEHVNEVGRQMAHGQQPLLHLGGVEVKAAKMDAEQRIVAVGSVEHGCAGEHRGVDAAQNDSRDRVPTVGYLEGGAHGIVAQIFRGGKARALENQLLRGRLHIAAHRAIVMHRELDGVVDGPGQREALDLDSLQRHVPGP